MQRHVLGRALMSGLSHTQLIFRRPLPPHHPLPPRRPLSTRVASSRKRQGLLSSTSRACLPSCSQMSVAAGHCTRTMLHSPRLALSKTWKAASSRAGMPTGTCRWSSARVLTKRRSSRRGWQLAGIIQDRPASDLGDIPAQRRVREAAKVSRPRRAARPNKAPRVSWPSRRPVRQDRCSAIACTR